MTGAPSPYLVTVSGQDGPGISERLFGACWPSGGVEVDDVEQVRVHGRSAALRRGGHGARRGGAGARPVLAQRFGAAGVEVTVEPLVEAELDVLSENHLVTLLAPEIDAATLETVTGSIARCGGNIERIVRLAAYPVHSYELAVAGADVDSLRRALAEAAARCQVDLAVQAAGLHRRAKHLIVLDADSTLLQGEMIDLLAERCGCGARGGRGHRGRHGGRDRLRRGVAPAGAPPGRSRRRRTSTRCATASCSRRAPARWCAP